jgi:hypothetical protein
VFSVRNSFESSLSLLFPKHTTFYCLDTGDCEIFQYKKDSKYNVLNWAGECLWPNDNANEFLTYQIHTETHIKFIDRCIYEYDEGFLYADLRSFTHKGTNNLFKEILTKLLTITNIPTLITYSSSLNLSDSIFDIINNWSTQNYLVINPQSGEVINVLTNYDMNKTKIGSAGVNAIDRQRISRKSSRWVAGFEHLPTKEQDYILMNLIGTYLKDRKDKK